MRYHNKQLLSLILFLLPVSVNATSFDCTKAWHRVEKVICADPHLSKLDSELGQLYVRIDKDKHLKQQQRIWILSRNQCVTSKDVKRCVASSYETRITQLRTLSEGLQTSQSGKEISTPVAVKMHYSLNTGNWYPLPEKDMKAAAVDTALAKLSETGNFSISGGHSNMPDSLARMEFNISLIGPAEVAKLTIKLLLPSQPSFVSTSSISVKNLNHQGIYKAFEHIGKESAKQLLAKFDAYVMKKPKYRIDEAINLEDQDKLRDLYQLAQRLKSEYKYQQARLIFEKVVASDKTGKSKWNVLSAEELRYGLPLFESKQSIISMGRIGNDSITIEEANLHAQNLLRQILADNTDNVQRMMETQRMLDELDVSRSALKNVVAANRMVKLKEIEIRLEQYYVMNGKYDKGVVDFLYGMEFVKEDEPCNFIIKNKRSQQHFRVDCRGRDLSVTLED